VTKLCQIGLTEDNLREAMNAYRRRAVLGLGLLVSVLLVVAYLVHFRAKWAVARYERQIVAAGETLNVRELYPPAVLPENNGALLFSQIMGRLSWGRNLLDTNMPPAMQMVAPGKAMVGWAQPDVRSGGTNTWNDVDEALARYRDALESVREAAERPAFDFQLDYREGYTLLLPHLAPLKHAVQLLTTDTLCDLHRGDAAAATTNVQAMLALVRATGDERLAISQLVRIAMAAISMAATWELLQLPNLSDDQLAAVQRDWAALRFVEPARESLAMERALNLMMLQRMRSSSAQFRQALSLGGSGPAGSGVTVGNLGDMLLRETVIGAKRTSWRLCTSYPDQLRALQGYQALLDGLRSVQAGQPFSLALSHQQTRLAALELHSEKEGSGRGFDPWGRDLSGFFSDSVVALSRILNRVLAAEVSRELATTALALKRYQLRHGQYPTELSALVPEYLAAVPRDPADGQPLRYRPRPDGTFLLYSVGEDGTDNGGDAAPALKSDTFGWQRGRDLVWPCPATAEEVSAYQQKHATKPGR
jgi:hypothetical protein